MAQDPAKNKASEEWSIGKGRKLAIEVNRTAPHLTVSLTLQGKTPCVLHWGVCRQPNGPWLLPPGSIWPQGSHAEGTAAVQTPFAPTENGGRVFLDLPTDHDFSILVFVLYFPEENRWDNNQGRNYFLRLPQVGESLLSPTKAMTEEIEGLEVILRQDFGLEAGRQLAVAVCGEKEKHELHLITDLTGPLLLHWGETNRSRNDWQPPPPSHRPKQTVIIDGKAARTPFAVKEGLNRLTLFWPGEDMPRGLSFVLFKPDTGQWLKNSGANIHIPLMIQDYKETPFNSAALADMADRIIEAETGRNSWTLMHRFNLCHDLLSGLNGDLEGLALLFVWLRFSSIRQLDWQRNYNTKPRELTHAQQRLTMKLAEHYRASNPASRELIRLIFSTLGRGAEGGKGQRIRDDILHIMHRHHVKEVTGHFLEEWHQKLHNNATPDDIVICEAYLAFLRSNGDLGAFFRTLEQGGVTRERLRSFERPIVTDPDFNPHIKDGLIHDFENYLALLKSVHSATDLKSALEEASHCLAGEENDRAWHIYNSRNDTTIAVVDRVGEITALRRDLKKRLDDGPDQQCIRDLLYLDLGLEEYLRVAVERDLHKSLSREQLTALIGQLLDNVRLSHPADALTFARRQWQQLIAQAADDRQWHLHARSVLDRLSRLLGSFIDTFYALLQPKAEHLGRAFNADGWTIDIFTQEVVRAGSPFVLSILIRQIDPILRRGAELGDWQIISHADATGAIQVAPLLTVQDRTYKTPTVLLSDKISGDEVIPKGVTAVLTAAGVDILSHVSIRARNAGVLFATCYSEKKFNALRDLAGKQVVLKVDARGEVAFEKSGRPTKGRTAKKQPTTAISVRRPAKRKAFAIAFEDFSSEVVGGKSTQLQVLHGKLPKWVRLPRSLALPFGVCERVLADRRNGEIKKRYESLIAKIDGNPAMLPELRKILMELEAPAALVAELQQTIAAAGLQMPEDSNLVWQRIKQVWASKWTERAYLSRRQMSIPHEDLYMAVLIQEVIGAEYAFVIHTANPFSGDHEELYAEVAPGLGETICSGNYPGRALSFTCRKTQKLMPRLLSFPGKNVALRGSGLIFRSDSNGEDLEEFAGAGLYESVLLTPPRSEVVDYTKIALLWDKNLRDSVLKKIAAAGIEVEKAMTGQAQDIEGAYLDGEYYVVQTRRQVGAG